MTIICLRLEPTHLNSAPPSLADSLSARSASSRPAVAPTGGHQDLFISPNLPTHLLNLNSDGATAICAPQADEEVLQLCSQLALGMFSDTREEAVRIVSIKMMPYPFLKIVTLSSLIQALSWHIHYNSLNTLFLTL